MAQPEPVKRVLLCGPLAQSSVIEELFGVEPGDTVSVPGLRPARGTLCLMAVSEGDGTLAARCADVPAAWLGAVCRALGLSAQAGETGGADLLVAATARGCGAAPADWAHLDRIWRHGASEVADMIAARGPKGARAVLGPVLSRAAARAAAEVAPRRDGGSGFDRAFVSVQARRQPYAGFFAVDELVFEHARFDGTRGPAVERAVFMAADAVTVLPYDPVRDRVLLVEQVRAGPLARGDAEPWVLEPVAGRIEPGDTPESTAHKEAAEEARVTLTALHHIAGYYPSTGCFSEFIDSYLGIADLPDDAARLGGLAAEGEDIRGHLMSRAEMMDRVRANRLPDAPLLLSAWWLEANVARLRGAG